VLFAVYVVIIQRFYHFVNPILAVGLFVAFLQHPWHCQNTVKKPSEFWAQNSKLASMSFTNLFVQNALKNGTHASPKL